MAASEQNISNHARYIFGFHIVLSALVAMIFFRAALMVGRSFTGDHLWMLAEASALMIFYWYVRAFPVGVQDRVIRLEMRLRLERLLPPEQFARFDQLAVGQVVALRFASDAELPGLVGLVLEGKLVGRGEIKKRIQNWQADPVRI